MSSPDRLSRRLLLLAALGLAGCGFTPAYSPGAPGRALLDRTVISSPATVAGYRMRTRLIERLGLAPDAPVYDLTTTLSISEQGVAVSPDGAITRVTLPGKAGFSLRAVGTDAILVQGEVEAFTGYSTTDSTVATQTARDDAIDRLAVILADLIVMRLVTVPGL